jgi:hypothetical protein
MLVEVCIGVCWSSGSRGVLGPAEDEVTVSCGRRDLGTRLAILLPDPAVDATVDDLEMSAVDF